jgi:hypothetical protein
LLFVGPQLLRMFKLQNYEVYTAKNVFTKIWQIITGASGIASKVVNEYPGAAGLHTDTTEQRDVSSTTYQL